MNKKLLKSIGILAMVLLAGISLSGCNGKVLEKESGTAAPKEQKEETVGKETGGGCLAGTEKTVVGRKYTTTGTETYTIQGKSMDLCCWEIGEGQQKKKICVDSTLSPVGYDNGILWETDKGRGTVHKSMETYREGSKVCQQFYNADGTTGPLNCQDRVN